MDIAALLRSWPLSFALPGCCAVCQAWGAQRVCTDCRHRFAARRQRCHQCAVPVVEGVAVCGGCLTDPPPLDAAWAAVDYAFPWSNLLPRLKFRQGLDLTGAFVDLMMAAPRPQPAGRAPVVLPVPLSRARLRQRGYNQAWELARRLAHRQRWTAWPDALLKWRDSAEQRSLPLSERGANVRGAYAVASRHRAALAGRAVVLVDDVMTSGATLHEIASLLREDAGVASVQAWVLARTPSHHAFPSPSVPSP